MDPILPQWLLFQCCLTALAFRLGGFWCMFSTLLGSLIYWTFQENSLITIPTPYWVKDDKDNWTINPEVLTAQKASYFDQRPAFNKENTHFIGLYNADGTVRLFRDMG